MNPAQQNKSNIIKDRGKQQRDDSVATIGH